jgi:hypothetical protein
VMQPTVSIKNAIQDQRPVPMNPRELYRGLLVNAGSIAPITAVQFGANRFYEGLVRSAGGSADGAGKIGIAAAAGATSALVACPAEVIMIQQQRNNKAMAAQAGDIIGKFGPQRLWRGVFPTMARESMYTCGYLGIFPYLYETLKDDPSLPSGAAFFVSGVAAGLTAATLTHPSDTIKTRMQANIDPEVTPQYRNQLSTLRQLLSEGGVGSLYAGFLPRAVRLVGATFILNIAKSEISEAWEKTKNK